MRNVAIIVATVLITTAAAAADGERTLTGAAIGAGAGAVVAGPVGAVAGGAIGAAVGGPRLPPRAHMHRHKIYWTDRRGHRHWRWSR